jgi:hypothetical protein
VRATGMYLLRVPAIVSRRRPSRDTFVSSLSPPAAASADAPFSARPHKDPNRFRKGRTEPTPVTWASPAPLAALCPRPAPAATTTLEPCHHRASRPVPCACQDPTQFSHSTRTRAVTNLTTDAADVCGLPQSPRVRRSHSSCVQAHHVSPPVSPASAPRRA